MSKITRDQIQSRLSQLFEEYEALEIEIDHKLQRANEIRVELNSLAEKLQEVTSRPITASPIMVNGVQTKQEDMHISSINGVNIRRGTIKDFVVQVLLDSPEGLSAQDILAAINARFNKNYTRTSLSPQLSRLKEDGVLGLRGPIWYLIMGNTKS